MKTKSELPFIKGPIKFTKKITRIKWIINSQIAPVYVLGKHGNNMHRNILPLLVCCT